MHVFFNQIIKYLSQNILGFSSFFKQKFFNSSPTGISCHLIFPLFVILNPKESNEINHTVALSCSAQIIVSFKKEKIIYKNYLQQTCNKTRHSEQSYISTTGCNINSKKVIAFRKFYSNPAGIYLFKFKNRNTRTIFC